MLQAWLQELPEPLVRFDLYFKVLHSQQYQDEAQRMNSLHDVLKKVAPLLMQICIGHFDAAYCAATRLLTCLGHACCRDQCQQFL